MSSMHQHLLIKSLQKQTEKHFNLNEEIKDMQVDYTVKGENRRILIQRIIQQLTKKQEGKRYIKVVSQKINSTLRDMFTQQSKKNLYSVQCLRESMSFPFKKQENKNFNFTSFHGQFLTKDLRRILWIKVLSTEQHRQNYMKYDRQISPYNLKNELGLMVEKISKQSGQELFSKQKDMAIRLLEYFLKAEGKLPHRLQVYVCVMVVKLYGHYSESRFAEVGGVMLGLMKLISSYRQEAENVDKSESRIINKDIIKENVMKCLDLIDPENQNLLKDYDNNKVIECFENFRLTMGFYFLSLDCSFFIIDQLIIRKFSKFSIYMFFSILLMVLSDELQSSELQQSNLKEILLKGKTIVSKQDIRDAYSVIFEKIPPFFNQEDLEDQRQEINKKNEQQGNQGLSPQNHLLEHLIDLEKKNLETEINQESDDDDNFVASLKGKARIGPLS